MFLKKINIWYLSSFAISIIVAVPIVTVFSSFFETTGIYSSIIKETFLYEYILNSIYLLMGVLFLTSDNFLLFTFLLILSHSKAHGSHGLEDLL